MTAIRSNPRRPVRASRPAEFAVESLDPRRLMSVAVPAGYVEVASLTLDAYTLAAQTVDVDAGHDYFFKATGTHVLAQNPTRLADAAGYQPTAGTWAAGTHLHVRLDGADVVSWGSAHAADSEYGASYTATADATLSAVITDTYRFDNQGSLGLTVYERVVLASLTGAEQGASNTASDATGAGEFLNVTPDGAGQATVDLSAGLASSPSAAAREMVLWAAYDGQGNVVAHDSFDDGGDSITFTFADRYESFTIYAGVDLNGDGVLEVGMENTRSMVIQMAQS